MTLSLSDCARILRLLSFGFYLFFPPMSLVSGSDLNPSSISFEMYTENGFVYLDLTYTCNEANWEVWLESVGFIDPLGLEINSLGEVLIVGFFKEELIFGTEILASGVTRRSLFILRLDQTGELLWFEFMEVPDTGEFNYQFLNQGWTVPGETEQQFIIEPPDSDPIFSDDEGGS